LFVLSFDVVFFFARTRVRYERAAVAALSKRTAPSTSQRNGLLMGLFS
jgi:hypothetical protein